MLLFLPSCHSSDHPSGVKLTTTDVAHAEKMFGLEFTYPERDSMIDGLESQLKGYLSIRATELPNHISPAFEFNPVPGGMTLETEQRPIRWTPVEVPEMSRDPEDLAYMSVAQLGRLLRAGKVTSGELTELFLERLKRYGPKLECVITLTEDLAREQAERADRELAAGIDRGPLHGIPYGAKDLLAAKGYPTTWGATPFKEQMIDADATVIRRLEDAGAVLVAKLTLGALAWGDVWFGGKTRSPWDYEQGSSGSSAGSASATAAGLVPFAIGSETWGSIVSPSTRCGTTALRPTYGTVSRSGAMALSWSMDKLGPICRNVEDCAIVFDAIRGSDGIDRSVRDVPFNYDPSVRLRNLRIGYVKTDFDSLEENKELLDAALSTMHELGADLIPIELPERSVTDLSIILSAEAAAAFDDFLRTRKTGQMVRQIKNAWPNEFRTSRFIPAVEYIQANRIRSLLIEDMAALMGTIDLYVALPIGDNLLLTNLTGHPCVVVPCGFREDGTPTSITFMGRLYGEAELLAVAKRYQDATGFHLARPKLQE